MAIICIIPLKVASGHSYSTVGGLLNPDVSQYKSYITAVGQYSSTPPSNYIEGKE